MEFLQLWILPDTPGLPPALQQRQYTRAQRTDRLLKVIGPEGGDVTRVHQNAAVYIAAMTAGTDLTHDFGPHRGGYLYLIEGSLRLENERLSTGDAVKIYEEPELRVHADDASELLLVDVPLRFTPVGVWARPGVH